MSAELKNIVESLLLVADSPLNVARIQALFDKESAPQAEEIRDVIEQLNTDYATRSIEIKKIGKGYRIQTRIQYAPWIRKLQAGKPPRMSRAQLETLAIIAYRQPVTRGDIEEVRGVSVSPEIMQRLSEREWIKQIGVRDVPGRPALFGTTPEFLAYFNLASLKDLPPLMEQRELGDIARDLEVPLPPEVLSALEGSALEVQQDMFEVSADLTDASSEDDDEHDIADDVDDVVEDGDLDLEAFDDHIEEILARDTGVLESDSAIDDQD